MVKILYLIEDTVRGKCVSVLSHLGTALERAGNTVRYLDPMSLITVHQQETYARFKKPFPLNSIKLLEFYDMVFYSLDSFHMDASNCPCKTVFVYDESWKGVRIPPGTDYLIATKHDLDLLEWASPWEFKHLKGIYTDLETVVDWEFWKDAVNVEKTIPFAYMGNIHTLSAWNPLLKETYETKRHFVLWAKEHLGLWYQDPAQNLEEFAETIPKVKIAVHFSEKNGVGQGAWEVLACGAILLEYPRSKAAEEAGLIEGRNCLFFNTRMELAAALESAKTNPELLAHRGRELVKQRHTIDSLVAPIKAWLNKIFPSKGDHESFIMRNAGNYTPVKLGSANGQKVFFNDEGSLSQTSRGKKSFNEMK